MIQEKHLTLAVGCDKPRCGRRLPVPDPEWATYRDEFRTWYAGTGWSMWAGRSQRLYCPEHGPADPGSMRRVQ